MRPPAAELPAAEASKPIAEGLAMEVEELSRQAISIAYFFYLVSPQHEYLRRLSPSDSAKVEAIFVSGGVREARNNSILR